MGKEDFYRQIEIAKQKIANEKLQAERKVAENIRQAKVIRKNEEIIEKNKEIRIMIETKNFFAGTNIIETLEEIRDEHLLIANRARSFRKSFFTGERIFDGYEDKPMIITYHVGSVTASFDVHSVRCSSGTNEGDGSYWDESYCRSIIITKTSNQKNNLFKLKYDDDNTEQWSKGFEISSTNSNDIINGIAKIVALEQTREKIKQNDLW